MSEVEFNEAQTVRRIVAPQKISFFSRMVMATSLATDEKGAQRILLIATIVIALIAVAVAWFGNGTSVVRLPPPEVFKGM